MKRKIIYLLFTIIAIVNSTTLVAQEQVYEKNPDGDYIIVENTAPMYMSYNPPQPNAVVGGIPTTPFEALSESVFFVTDNKTETLLNPTRKLNQGGMKLNLYYPKVLPNKIPGLQKLPVIIYGYGGGFTTPYYLVDKKIEKWLAKKGYIVVVPEYRLGIDLRDSIMAKRAVWRAVQDVRKVISKCRSLQTASYAVDENKPITYVGYSSGGFIGLHNLYFNNTSNRPASTKAGYSCQNIPLGHSAETCETYDLGTLDDPKGGDFGGQDIGMSSQYVQDITVSLAGALGDVGWIKNNSVVKPKALYMIHHPVDGVVPFSNGPAYKNFGLFISPRFQYPIVSGSNTINNVFKNPNFSNLKPSNYKFKYLSTNYYPDSDYMFGDAGSEIGSGYKTWYHDPANGGTNILNENLMQSILYFIQASTYNILNPSSTVAISKQSEIDETAADNDIAITLYPNPVKGDILNITAVVDNTPYKITNTLGQVLITGTINNGTININTLSTGSYFIELVTNEQHVIKQFIKQ